MESFESKAKNLYISLNKHDDFHVILDPKSTKKRRKFIFRYKRKRYTLLLTNTVSFLGSLTDKRGPIGTYQGYQVFKAL